MYLQIAWRNIWRNKRRTFVILMAVVIGVWSMIFLSALMRGIAKGMIANGIKTLTGHVQVHQKDYRNDPAIENSIQNPQALERLLAEKLPPTARWVSRIRLNAIASNAHHSSGVTLVGIDPQKEAGVSFIGSAVFEGEYLKADAAHDIVVGAALLDEFETRIGHKLVLMSQGTDQQIASRAFRIVGVFRAEMEATEKEFVFVTRAAAQKMLGLKDAVSEISILLPEGDAEVVAAGLRLNLDPSLMVTTWREQLPVLTAYLRIVDGFIYIWYVVVFIAMGFGIVNTTLMAIFERIREYGLLKALGMKPWWIIRGVLSESFLILCIGMGIGNLLAVFSIWILAHTGIDLSALAQGAEYAGMARIIYPAINSQDWLAANGVVLVLGLLVSLYPASKAARFTPIEALAHT